MSINTLEPIAITLTTPFQLGEWQVDPAGDRLLRDREEVKLEPKVMQVLLCLAQQPGVVLARETLEATVWAGTIVSYDALASSVIKLRKALGDDSRHPHYIETISKKGYRLIAKVSFDTASVTQNAIAPVAADNHTTLIVTAAAQRLSPLNIISALSVFILVLAVVIGVVLTRSDKDTGQQPSILVMPFTNLSEDPQQTYFSEGIADDITTELSKIGSLQVIARQTALQVHERKLSLSDIAKSLQVQYVLQGSVQKSANRLRINVQLSNTHDGHQLWAERYDTETSNLFTIQDEITHKVAHAMTLTLSQQESERLNKTVTLNFAAYDAFLQGQQFLKNRNKEGFEQSIDAYRRAIQLDPDFGRAYGAMAVSYTYAYRDQWTDLSLDEARQLTLRLAKQAVALDNTTPQIYWALGFVHLHRKEFDEAEKATRHAVELSPNYADGYGLLAFIENWRNKPKDALKHINKAIALNPYHTMDYPWNVGLANYLMGNYPEAIKNFIEVTERSSTTVVVRLFLASAYVRTNKMDDARWEITQIRTDFPHYSLSHLASVLPIEQPSQREALLQDLRKAGLPE